MPPKLKLSLPLNRRKQIKILKEVKLPFTEDKSPWYLNEYIEKVRKDFGEPEVVEKLTGEYKFKKQYNVIYPVGNGIFIHVVSTPSESGYNKYIVVEPPRPPEKLLRAVEEAIAMRISEEHVGKSPEERIRILVNLIEDSLRIDDKADISKIDGGPHRLVSIPRKYKDLVIYHMVRDKIGVGVLEPFLRDPYLEDISCSGMGPIYVVHKMFGPLETNIEFKEEADLNRFILALAEKIGKPLSHARPIVDATLPDGSRINIVYGSDVSLRGSNFTIRRISKIPLSVTQLINWGTFDERIAAYMWMLLSEGMSVFICGETASGKTTSLTAMLVFIRPSAKIVSIEDTAEVIVPHPNWTRELTRDTGKPESSVTMFDLLRAALRQRPNYIIVGEIRGAEGNIAFQAMQSVAWDEPVAVKVGSKVDLVRIGELVDEIYSAGVPEKTPIRVSSIRTLTLTPSGRLAWRPVTYVLRHRAEYLSEVSFEGGSIKVTDSHSLYVLDLRTLSIKPKEVREIRVGDLLVAPGRSAVSRFSVWGDSVSTYLSQTVPAEVIREIVDEAGLDFRVSGGRVGREEVASLLRQELTGRKEAELSPKLVRGLGLLNSDVTLVRVTGIRSRYYGDFVYDLSVPKTELFFGGRTPVALHNTGHPVISTFHAADIDRLIQRITSHPINVPKTHLDALNVAWFQSAVYTKQGFLARRVIRIYEIVGYDPSVNNVLVMPVFSWDPIKDRFIFSGRGSSYLLEEKIATMKGIPRSRLGEIYEELELRAKFLRALVDKKVFHYWDVWKAVVKASQIGLEEAYRRLLRGDLV